MVRGRLVVVALAILGLAACAGQSPSHEANRRYVAMGDSYVSGPGIAKQDPASPECGRSNRNYSHLVAAKLKRTTLVDVSCAGATTASVRDGLLTNRDKALTPQLDALTPATKLVTVGVGANDQNLYLGMFLNCLVKKTATETKCRKFAEDYAPTVYPATRNRIEAILSTVKKRAPQARILLIGYLRIVPESGDCRSLEVTKANRAEALTVEVAMTEVLRDAARTANVQFVDVRGISKGHDVCAGKDAWVNGSMIKLGNGAVLHPNKAGMRAVAGVVLKAIGKF